MYQTFLQLQYKNEARKYSFTLIECIFVNKEFEVCGLEKLARDSPQQIVAGTHPHSRGQH